MIEIQKQPVAGRPVSPGGFVLQDDGVVERPIAALVTPVEVAAEWRQEVLPRDAAQEQRLDPLVEQYLVVELRVAGVQRGQLGRPVLELDDEPMATAAAVRVAHGDRPVQHDGRELLLSRVTAVQRERHEAAARAESSGVSHLHDRPVDRPIARRRHRSVRSVPVTAKSLPGRGSTDIRSRKSARRK